MGNGLCVDTDALVALLALGCFDDALKCLGCSERDCFRLPAAVAQIRKSRWVGERWPHADRSSMAEVAERLRSLPPPEDLELQDRLNSIPDIDEGDAFLLAKASETPRLLLLSGDGRMYRALLKSAEQDTIHSLRGRVTIFPQVVGALVRTLTVAEVEIRWRSACSSVISKRHRSLSVMFGSTSPTREEDFWSGHDLQVGHVVEVCGKDWLREI